MQEIDKRAPDSLQAGRQTARAPAGRCKVVHLHLPGFCFSVFAEHHSCTMSDSEMPPSHLLQCEIRQPMLVFHCTSSLDTRPAVLNLWAAAHWWAADLCLVGRDQCWELRNFLCESRVKVLVVEFELPLHT